MKQIQRLIDIMDQLRDPDNGCPWDLEQDFSSLTAYTLEETHELIEAIESKDNLEIKKELGDLLFHIIFYAHLAKEQSLFDLEDIAESVCDKMIFRHPHVFDIDKNDKNRKKKSKKELERDWIRLKKLEG